MRVCVRACVCAACVCVCEAGPAYVRISMCGNVHLCIFVHCMFMCVHVQYMFAVSR